MNPEPSSLSFAPDIVYSCHASRFVAAAQCSAEHSLSYLVAGSIRATDAGASYTFEAGSVLFVRRDFLAKVTKQPAENAPFRAITIVFTRAMLLQCQQQYGLRHVAMPSDERAVRPLAASPALLRFFDTLQPYFDGPLPAPLVRLKQQEALWLLLQAQPEVHAALFDFGQPGKIDLQAFMQRHFRFNLEVKQLAYLTGRSLAAFKRDFAQIFHTSPNRWLYQKRLEEAHYLLTEQNRRPSDVYHEVGFESLAHFSKAFKQFFGRNPSSSYLPTPAG